MATDDTSATPSIFAKLENVIVITLQILLVTAVAVATIVACFLFLRGLILYIPHTTSVDFLHEILDRTFGGILIVFLGLELLETFKVYFKEHEVRVEAVIVAAIGVRAFRHCKRCCYRSRRGTF